ncbi:MAG: alpha/beta hydrolase [Desulfuromonadales bacterium]|nr:alpha/beta hydrolase [Desulfuromonadales bacterium]
MSETGKATTLAYDDHGSGQPLLLIHGFPLNRKMWRPQVAALTEAGYRVITPDLRGFGESRRTSAAVNMSSYADDIVALMDRLQLPQAVVGGMSMGGYVLLNLLERYPERVSAAIFIVTRAGADDEAGKAKRTALAARTLAEGMDPVLEVFRNILFAPATLAAHPALVAEVCGWISATDRRGAAAGLIAMRERKDYLPLLGAIRQPALVIGAEQDQAIPGEQSHLLAAGITDAKLAILPGGGHLVSLEQPDGFNAAIKEFLAEVGHFQ